MIDGYIAFALALVAFSGGALAGHAVGYGRGLRLKVGAYRRVGRPE